MNNHTKSFLDKFSYHYLISDLSYNKLENGSARAIGKLLNGHSHLVSLDLTNNRISVQGAAAIAHALAKNETLKSLSLRLNR